MSTWNRALETLPRAELESLQLKGLRKTLRRLCRPEVSTLADLARLGFCSVKDLSRQPLLSRCQVDRHALAELRLDASVNPPLALAETKADLLQDADALARAFAMAGVEKGDAVAILEPLAADADGLAAYQGCRKAGLFTLPLGGLDPQRQDELLTAHHAKAVVASVASLLRLSAVAKHPPVRVALVPSRGLTEGLRRELEARFGFAVFALAGLPVTGGLGTLGAECREHAGLHIWEDRYLVEIVDQNGNVLPDGERGELVVTTLDREALPLLRYRTGCTAAILTRAPCVCGRTSLRLAL